MYVHFIYKREREGEREMEKRQRELFLLFIDLLPDSYSSQGWAKKKSRAWNSNQIFHRKRVLGDTQITEPPFVASHRMLELKV